ncbi:hypothetical protein JD969_03010 [Planctomycetota bacterium]|nr:hypothetical protein JD969_03010 [Planctomycetota bacterium]
MKMNNGLNRLFWLFVVVMFGFFGWTLAGIYMGEEVVEVAKAEVVEKEEVKVEQVASKESVEVEVEKVEKVEEKKEEAIVKKEEVKEEVVEEEKEEVDPDAERRANFESSIDDIVAVARGGDFVKFMKRLIEPGSEYAAQMDQMAERMDRLPPQMQERFSTMMNEMADTLEGLDWDELEWDGEEVLVSLPEMGPGGQQKGRLYEADGVWYMKPPGG